MPRGGKRIGAGRKATGATVETKVIRVAKAIDKDMIDNIPQLLELLAMWKEDLEAHPVTRTSNARYWKAQQLYQNIIDLGYVPSDVEN